MLQRREELGPPRVRGVQALVDDRRAFSGVPGGKTLPRQVRGQGPSGLAGPEHYMQPVLTHG